MMPSQGRAGDVDVGGGFRVTYTTVRRAMEVLRERGLIITRHGRGTFITRGR